MIMPLGDENRPGGGPYFVTWSLIAINVLVFLLELQLGESFIMGYSVVPEEIITGKDITGDHKLSVPQPLKEPEVAIIEHTPGPTPIYLTLLTSMFMHAGWLHVLGNMLYLFIFGDNLEDIMGHWRFLIFYLLCGFAASAAHIASDPHSLIPSLGASGAISGVLGGYMLLFPKNMVTVLLFRFVTRMPAVAVLGLWIVLQLVSGVGSLTDKTESGGVAYWAHIGGFVAGMALVFLFRGPDRAERERYRYTRG